MLHRRKLLLLILCVRMCSCVHINVKKTVKFQISELEPPEDHVLFQIIEKDGDGPRNLLSACHHQCHFQIYSEEWDAKAKTLTVSVFIHWFWSGEPWLYGHLSLCWGDKNIFRQFPITQRNKSMWNCKRLTDRVTEPEITAMEPLSVGIYTWFMSIGNYDELRLSGSTDLLIPLLPETYKLTVYVMIFHMIDRHSIQCTLQRPYVPNPTPINIKKRGNQVRHYSKHLTRVMFQIKSTAEKSGTYTVSCKEKLNYTPGSVWFPLQVIKQITLRFEKVPRIELVGHAGNTVFIPHSNETGEFYVNIYSTSDIVAFHITRSDGVESKAAGHIVTEHLSHPYHSLLAKYRVSLPWVDESITGPYTITVRNKQEQSTTLAIRLHKVEELVVLVNPTKLDIGEASSASFHCLVLTDMPTKTTVKWSYGPNILEGSKELNVSGNRRAVELSLNSTNVSQSGPYTCVAENGFQRVEKSIMLSVFPPGVHSHKPQPKATWMQRMSSDKALDMSTMNTMKKAGKVVGILVLVVLVVVAAAGAGVLVFRKVRRWMEQKKAESELETRDPDNENDIEVNPEEETQPLLKEKSVEDDSDLAELLQNVETHAKSHSSKRKKDQKKPTTTAKKRKISDSKMSELSETHTKSPSSKRKEKGKKRVTESTKTDTEEEDDVNKSTPIKKSKGKKKQGLGKTPNK